MACISTMDFPILVHTSGQGSWNGKEYTTRLTANTRRGPKCRQPLSVRRAVGPYRLGWPENFKAHGVGCPHSMIHAFCLEFALTGTRRQDCSASSSDVGSPPGRSVRLHGPGKQRTNSLIEAWGTSHNRLHAFCLSSHYTASRLQCIIV